MTVGGMGFIPERLLMMMNDIQRPLTPKSTPTANDEHAELKAAAPNNERKNN